jgi:putative two-component system response regulator
MLEDFGSDETRSVMAFCRPGRLERVELVAQPAEGQMFSQCQYSTQDDLRKDGWCLPVKGQGKAMSKTNSTTLLDTPIFQHGLARVPEPLKQLSVLIVEDNEAHATLIVRTLRRCGLSQLRVLHDPRLVVAEVLAKQPDLILLDYAMPFMTGLELVQALKASLPAQVFLPLIVLSANGSSETRQRVLAAGVADFLAKPIDEAEVCLRVGNQLKTRYYYLALQEQHDELERRVSERTEQLEISHVEMLTRLAKVAEYRNDESSEHIWRVAKVSSLIAKAVGFAEEDAELFLRAARLHDVGKIAIPDGILFKPGKLTASEFEVVKSHTTIGAEILSGSRSELLQLAEVIALTHHERWDGTGYPRGLKAEAIPLEGRILAIADTFDALTHDQPHRRAFSMPEAIEEIQRQRGKQFDPDLVEAFLKLYWAGKLSIEKRRALLDGSAD